MRDHSGPPEPDPGGGLGGAPGRLASIRGGFDQGVREALWRSPTLEQRDSESLPRSRLVGVPKPLSVRRATPTRGRTGEHIHLVHLRAGPRDAHSRPWPSTTSGSGASSRRRRTSAPGGCPIRCAKRGSARSWWRRSRPPTCRPRRGACSSASGSHGAPYGGSRKMCSACPGE